MSVYRKKAEKFYRFDFWLEGRRFLGSCGVASKREAIEVERQKRDEARREIAAEQKLAGGPLTLDAAALRYWQEVGQYHKAKETTFRNLQRLVEYFGKEKRLAELTDDDVARLVSWRRAQTVAGRASAAHVSPATVNRSTIEPLQKLFSRARKSWRLNFDREPTWSLHLLKEAGERVREVRPIEEVALEAAIPPAIKPLVAFARASGLRLAECLLQKSDVDLVAGRISTKGKGGKIVSVPITSEMRAILMAEMANPTEHVFTYTVRRPRAAPETGRQRPPKGKPAPLTVSYVKTVWRRARAGKYGAALPADLRFHDLRHDFATKLLRETGNLKLVQRALNHAKVETTTRYAHVLDDEILAGMEAASARRKGKA